MPGGEISEGITFPSAHLITPETDTTTHYFWLFGRNFDLDNHELTRVTLELADSAFSTQDKPMIESAQERITSTGATLSNFSPGDSASARARTIIRKMMPTGTVKDDAAE